MPNMEAIFSQFDAADPTAGGGRSDKITVHGVHKVEIESVRIKDSEQGHGLFLIVEFKVHETDADLVREGHSYGWAHNLQNKWYGASNAKQFLAAAVGLDPSSPEAKALGKSELEEAIGKDQPLTGATCILKTRPKPTANSSDFTIHEWSALA